MLALAEPMQNRQEVIQEYFKLRVLLNRGNATANQKTEITLYLARANQTGLELRARVVNSGEGKYLVLAYKTAKERWRAAGHLGLSFLEDFLCDFLEKAKLKNKKNTSDMINDELSQTSVRLNLELRSLGNS